MKEKVKSPFSNEEAVLETSIPSSKIIDLFMVKMKIDVSRLFKNLNFISIYKCPVTTFRFYYPFHISGDGEFYENILLDNSYYSKWKYEYEVAKTSFLSIKGTPKVLDIGCGYGYFLSGLNVDKANCYGIEFNKKAVEYANAEKLNVTLESIENHSLNNYQKYNLITAFQVLEHVPNVNSFISSTLNCLKKNGTLIIAVPNNEPYFAVHHKMALMNLPPHHMGLWNLESLTKVGKLFNLKLKNYYYDQKISIPYYLYFSFLYLIKNSNGKENIISAFTKNLITVIKNSLSLFKQKDRYLNKVIIVEFEKE